MYSMAKRFITTVIGTEDDDNDNNLVYVKEHEKREWLRNLLQGDAREDVYIENIDEHYEDMKSLNKLDVLCVARNMKQIVLYKIQTI